MVKLYLPSKGFRACFEEESFHAENLKTELQLEIQVVLSCSNDYTSRLKEHACLL